MTSYLFNDHYCLDGFIGNSQNNLELLFLMGKEALWTEVKDHDAALEGALLWQAMLINLEHAD